MTKADLTKTHALDLVNISVRLYQIQKDLIERAAKKMGHDTPSDYIRDTLTYQAALDMNEELPKIPDISRGRAGSLVHQAAAKLGMSKEDFEREAIRFAAAQALGANALENPRPARDPRSGTYARANLPIERPMAPVKAGQRR